MHTLMPVGLAILAVGAVLQGVVRDHRYDRGLTTGLVGSGLFVCLCAFAAGIAEQLWRQ